MQLPNLLPSQVRELEAAIRSSPLAEHPFEIRMLDASWAGYNEHSLPAIVHESTGYSFCADHHDEWSNGLGDYGPAAFQVHHAPTVHGHAYSGQVEEWDDVLKKFHGWLRLVARELGIEGVVVPRSASSQERPYGEVWTHMHPEIVQVARSRFDSGHLADSVEAALKHINELVKARALKIGGSEKDGASLMRYVFSPSKPMLALADLKTESGMAEQQGFMDIFAGAMTGVRNPKAHANVVIDHRRAIHLLYLASLLRSKLDEAREAT